MQLCGTHAKNPYFPAAKCCGRTTSNVSCFNMNLNWRICLTFKSKSKRRLKKNWAARSYIMHSRATVTTHVGSKHQTDWCEQRKSIFVHPLYVTCWKVEQRGTTGKSAAVPGRHTVTIQILKNPPCLHPFFFFLLFALFAVRKTEETHSSMALFHMMT